MSKYKLLQLQETETQITEIQSDINLSALSLQMTGN